MFGNLKEILETRQGHQGQFKIVMWAVVHFPFYSIWLIYYLESQLLNL